MLRTNSKNMPKNNLAGARRIEIFHNGLQNQFSGPCAGDDRHHQCQWASTICEQPYCHYMGLNEDEMFFHEVLYHSSLDNVFFAGSHQQVAKFRV